MEKRIIWRGLLAGASAGVLAFIFARLFLEPVIGRAIDFEEGRGEAESAVTGVHEHEMELFTRGVQSNIGMGLGVFAFSVAMGALFAVAFVVAYNRVSGLSARALALVMAAVAFGAVYLVPFLKYPANPPSVGDADTIGKRTGLYLLMIVLSLACAVAAVWLAGRLRPNMGAWGSTLSALGAYAVAMAVVMLVLPPISETPQPVVNDQGAIAYPGFPADDLFHFRLYAVGTQLIVWATIGLVFGALISRLLGESTQTRALRDESIPAV
ncbi:MAG TPA: CbtA family protein [Mycobacterium sp.]|nr:CbtA family protein [Mycobacterium sp.]